jgi:hypothetical protein
MSGKTFQVLGHSIADMDARLVVIFIGPKHQQIVDISFEMIYKESYERKSHE